jgi:hypothetical protein
MNVSTISLPSQISYGAAKVASDSADMETAKGKSGMPPGQMAKQAIAEAGLENAPANLHGKVTSALARGLDITSLLTVQENTVEDPAPVEVPTDGETARVPTRRRITWFPSPRPELTKASTPPGAIWLPH